MTRSLFGVASSDWAVTLGFATGVLVASDGTGTVWDAQTGGNQITDLLDASGQPTATVVAKDGQYRFSGPDGLRSLWIDFGGGRELLAALPDLVADIQTAISAAMATVVATVVDNGDGTFTYSSAAAVDNGDGTYTIGA